MSKTVFARSIKSRPVYSVFTFRQGSHHILIADGEGAGAILDLVKSAPKSFLASAHIIYVLSDVDPNHSEDLENLGAKQFYAGPSYDAALSRIHRVFSDAANGVQIYLAGSEGLMGRALHDAMTFGHPFSAIQTEHRGSKARRMQCVHCKGITENVTTDPFVCSHCGLNLFVRDHYSRRIAAFQGVRVDAEDHGNVPKAVEIT